LLDLEPLVITFAILFGFVSATLIFTLIAGGSFPYFFAVFFVMIISMALFFAFGNTFRGRTRIYMTLAAAVTASYFSYAVFIFPSNGLSAITDLTNTGNAVFRIAYADIFANTTPKLVQENLIPLIVAVIDVVAMIPMIKVLGSRENRPVTSMSLSERFWDVMHDRSTFINGLKYVAHGLLFQLLATALLIVGMLTVAELIVFGSYFGIFLGSFWGLVVAIVLLITVAGLANTLIARVIWGIPIQISLMLVPGWFSMFLGLLVVNLPVVVLPQIVFPGIATTIATFFPAVLLDGMIGKKIAEAWTD
jgi:hypothetical protein